MLFTEKIQAPYIENYCFDPNEEETRKIFLTISNFLPKKITCNFDYNCITKNEYEEKDLIDYVESENGKEFFRCNKWKIYEVL